MSNLTIYQELRTQYNTLTPPPTEFPNETFVRPGTNKTKPVLWARYTIVEGMETQLTFGAPTNWFRINAQLIIQLFAPLNSGMIAISTMADTLADGLRNWCGTSITCRSASVRNVGEDKDGWYQVNILVEFKMDSLH